MAVTKAENLADSQTIPTLLSLATACHALLNPCSSPYTPLLPIKLKHVSPATPPVTKTRKGKTWQAFCFSALALPGMLPQALADTSFSSSSDPQHNHENMAGMNDTGNQNTNSALSTDYDGDDEAGFQFNHYEEGNRAIWILGADGSKTTYTYPPHSTHFSTRTVTNNSSIQQTQNIFQPITVDSQHGFGRFRFGDRNRVAFNFNQDVWSGASPISTALATSGENNYNRQTSGASPEIQTPGLTLFNAQGQPFYLSSITTVTTRGAGTTATAILAPTSKLQQTMAYASPEIRNQADVKLGYDWDNASLDVGGGTSSERDYNSNFGNMAARFDFNQKLTTLNIGLSYTDSHTHAENEGFVSYNDYSPSQMTSSPTGIGNPFLNGRRRDEAITLAFSQVLNKNSLLTAGFGFTQSSGFMANPYKAVTFYALQPNNDWRSGYNLSESAFPGLVEGSIISMAEKRPELRNQFNWDTSYLHYIEPLSAAAKLSYNFFHDDWGINAHTFAGEWRQELGSSWTLTPSVRYYSQSAANFYAPYFVVSGNTADVLTAGSSNQQYAALSNSNFSSDQRLAAFGALSGGLTLSKQISRGLNVELGVEYYSRANSLTLGGNGSGAYLDYHYYVANAGIRANFAKLASVSAAFDADWGDPRLWLDNSGQWLIGLLGDQADDDATHAHHAGHHHDHSAPAGVMFAHMMDQPGDYMVGYRYMRSTQSGDLGTGTQNISQIQASLDKVGCFQLNEPNKSLYCGMYPTKMTMNMHMLDLMYAPTSWLNLMLMPQYMSMDMDMGNQNRGAMAEMGAMSYMRSWQSNGGFGDTSAYALFRLWDGFGQHVHVTQGFSIPTGSVNIKAEGFSNGLLYPYDMQLGSGTWDYKPSFTYTGTTGDVFWGGQASGTKRMQNQNSQGYVLGDILQGSVWAGYQFNNWLSATVRGLYTQQGKIKVLNSNSLNCQLMMTDCYAANTGGTFGDVGFGMTLAPSGRLSGNTLSAEWLQPVYTQYNGYQLDRTGTLSVTWNYGF